MTRKSSNKNSSSSPDTSPLRMPDVPPSAEELRRQGEAASQQLESPIYNLAHRSVIMNLQDEWMTTSPHETQKREGLYQQIRGLSAVAGEMAMMVNQAKQIEDDELAKERKLTVAYNENSGF